VHDRGLAEALGEAVELDVRHPLPKLLPAR
jgi:hypothetical protein